MPEEPMVARVCPTDERTNDLVKSMQGKGLQITLHPLRGAWTPFLFIGNRKVSGFSEIEAYFEYRLKLASKKQTSI